MIFNVRLRQSRVYDTAVDADTAEQAVQLARKASRHDPANWAAEGPVRKVSVEPASDQVLPDCSEAQLDELMDEIVAEIIASIYFSDDNPDNPAPIILLAE